MATYPVLNQSYESTVSPIDNNKVSTSADGTLRAKVTYSETVFELNVVHPFLSTTDKDSIITFYNTNKNLNFTFNLASESQDYTCIFKSQPEVQKISSSFWNVTMKAIGTQV